MSRTDAFVEFVVERMRGACTPDVRAMFGGYGLYHDGRIFAIVLDGRLYLRTRGSDPHAPSGQSFTYALRGRTVTMPYAEAAADVFEDTDAMRGAVQAACAAALEASRARRRDDMRPRTRAARARSKR
jgi:DNA transformation protein